MQVNLFKAPVLFSVMKVPPKEISISPVLAVSFRLLATLSVSSAEFMSSRLFSGGDIVFLTQYNLDWSFSGGSVRVLMGNWWYKVVTAVKQLSTSEETDVFLKVALPSVCSQFILKALLMPFNGHMPFVFCLFVSLHRFPCRSGHGGTSKTDLLVIIPATSTLFIKDASPSLDLPIMAANQISVPFLNGCCL